MSFRNFGEEPVAPPRPSMVMKSHPDCEMNSRSSSMCPAAIFTPMGFPPVLERSMSTVLFRSSGVSIPGNAAGLWMSCPGLLPLITAIMSVTLAPGRWPPMPGLVPWPIFISTASQASKVIRSALYPLGTYSKM